MKRQDLWAILGLLVFAVVSYWVWFFQFGNITNGDWGFYFHLSQSQLLRWPNLWSGQGLGMANIGLSMYPTEVIWGLLSHVANFPVSERLLYLYPSVLFAVVSSYWLVRRVTQSVAGGVIGSLLFTYNTYFMLGRTGHLTLMAGFALAPAVLVLFMDGLEQKSLKSMVWASVLSVIAGFYEFRSFYIMAWILFFYLIYHILVHIVLNKKERTWKNLFQTIGLVIIPSFLFSAANIWWLFGLAKTGSITDNPITSRGLFGNDFMNIKVAATLFHPFWTGHYSYTFIVQPILWYFWIIPVVVVLGLLLNIRKPIVWFFAFISFVGVMLSKQAGTPFPNMYLWLYNNLPGFDLFRESSKFFFVTALGYSVLAGSFVAWLWRKQSHWSWTSLKVLITVALAVLFAYNVRPAFNQQLGTLMISRNTPSDYFVLRDFLEKQPDYFRTMWVPTTSRWGLYSNNHPIFGLVDQLDAGWTNLVRLNQDFEMAPINERMKIAMTQSFSEELIDDASVKYVIVPLRDKTNEDDFFVFYGDDRNFYTNFLDQQPYLKKLDVGTKDVTVYQNLNYKPQSFSLTHMMRLDSIADLSFFRHFFKTPGEELAFHVVDPTKPSTSTVPSTHFDKTNLPILENGINIVPNPSFEQSSWQKDVDDCDMIDTQRPKIDQAIDTKDKTDGNQSLVLTASVHTACVKTNFPMQSGDYYLSFDYKTLDSRSTAYYLRFNPSTQTVQPYLPGTNGKWVHYERILTAPDGTTNADLYLYAHGWDADKPMVNHFDNIHLVKIESGEQRATFFTDTTATANPKDIVTTWVTADKRTIHVSGATKPFYFIFNESYHPDWRLIFTNQKVRGWFRGWWPGVQSDRIADTNHFSMAQLYNAWYVDVPTLCQNQTACHKNADGSYDIDMTIEFWSQRYLDLGILISGILVLAGGVAVGFIARRTKAKAKKKVE